MAKEKKTMPGPLAITLFVIGGIVGFHLGDLLSDHRVWEQYFSWVFAGVFAIGSPVVVAHIFWD